MSYMASSEDISFTSLSLHEKLDIPKQYLRRLLTRLSKKGLLVSDKGRGKGFVLAKAKIEIYLSEIIAASDDTPILQSCALGFETCRLIEKCPLHDRWCEAKQKITEIFGSVSLADMDIRMK
jgi:Rrf2 family transcriptional regulator, iron-sulfur cluster assembly transcription factor